MGFRFRKGIRIIPGVRLNITKHGISSVSVGGKGLTYNIGRKGTRTTGSLSGTGLSYSKYNAYEQEKVETQVDQQTGEITQRASAGGPPWALIGIIAAVIGIIYALRS